jgi:hypothetical protein
MYRVAVRARASEGLIQEAVKANASAGLIPAESPTSIGRACREGTGDCVDMALKPLILTRGYNLTLDINGNYQP